jgi:hypothetical protein
MPLHVKVPIPDAPVMLVGLTEHTRPVEGEIVDVTGTPGFVVTNVEMANIWKSTT